LLLSCEKTVDLGVTLCLAFAGKVDLFPCRFLRVKHHLKGKLHSWLTAKHGSQTLVTRDNLVQGGSHLVGVDFAVNRDSAKSSRAAMEAFAGQLPRQLLLR
jgi:hypothetical protein